MMSRIIDMYNTYFGDCFVIRDEDSDLVVDFGIHQNASVSGLYGSKASLTRDIANDLSTNYDNLSLLITHFHYDHVSGLIYMMKDVKKSRTGKRKKTSQFDRLFKKIYIPNIWNNPFTIVSLGIEEKIFELQLKKSGLPHNPSLSLFDLIDYIGINAKHVKLLSRGVEFENKFVALWPLRKDDKDEFREALENLNVPPSMIDGLYRVAEKICIYMQNVLISSEQNDSVEYSMETMAEYSEQFDDILSDNEDRLGNLFDDNQLNKLNHKYNIVFQDIDLHPENVLFTGDAEVEHLEEIKRFADEPKLKNKYKYIKIPHHGTPNHYFNFSKCHPDIVLIPNGAVSTHLSDPAYMIDARYGVITFNTKHRCSNTNNCSCGGISICKGVCNGNGFNRDLVFPYIKKSFY